MPRGINAVRVFQYWVDAVPLATFVTTIEAAFAAGMTGHAADLWFHSLVMLAALDQHPQAVLDELERRFGLSGHDEKASRSND